MTALSAVGSARIASEWRRSRGCGDVSVCNRVTLPKLSVSIRRSSDQTGRTTDRTLRGEERDETVSRTRFSGAWTPRRAVGRSGPGAPGRHVALGGWRNPRPDREMRSGLLRHDRVGEAPQQGHEQPGPGFADARYDRRPASHRSEAER